MTQLGSAVLVVFSVVSVATADITWYTDQAEFEAAATAAGLSFFELEDYEECTLPPNSITTLNDPLAPGVPNESFPAGMTGVSDMIVQSNLLAGSPDHPNPRGSHGLNSLSVGFFGASSDGVVSNYFVDSHDLDFYDGAEKRAVGFNTLTFLGGTTVEIRAYGVNEVFLGMTTVGADPGGSFFVGVITADGDQLIGRINVFDDPYAAEGADNIQTWIPEPASLALLALGGLLIRRR